MNVFYKLEYPYLGNRTDYRFHLITVFDPATQADLQSIRFV